MVDSTDPDSVTGAGVYVDSLSYTGLGQPLQYTMGTSAEPAYITDSYTRRPAILPGRIPRLVPGRPRLMTSAIPTTMLVP